MAGEKTEKATPKRRQDERKKGNIFQSKEIPVVATLLVTFYSLKFLLPISISALEKNITKIITSMASVHITTAAVMQIFIDCVITVCIAALPVILITCFVAIVAVEVQTRGLVTFDQIKFKMSKLNPLTGIKNM
ncbi:MAG: EscU/YscU/HrcU family type III secretion system export apparatus switch protein, partial [Oscillospiraceae bacterium]